MKNQLFTLFFLILSIIMANAQSAAFTFPDYDESSVSDGLEAADGSIACAGWIHTGDNGRQMLFFRLSSDSSQLLTRASLGDGLDDAAHALAQTYDGCFVLGGYTEISKNARKPQLIKVTPNGRVIWQCTDIAGGFGEIKDVMMLNNGNIGAVGEKEGKAHIWVISSRGEMLSGKSLGFGGKAQQMAAGPEGSIGITGFKQQAGNKISAFLVEKDETLDKNLRGPFFSADEGLAGMALAYQAELQRVVIAASAPDKADGPVKIYFLEKTAKSFKSFFPEEEKEQHHRNEAAFLLPLPDGQFLIGGATNRIGLTYGPMWAVYWRISDLTRPGQKNDEAARAGADGLMAGILLHNGKIALCGVNMGAALKKKSKAMVYHLPSTQKFPSTASSCIVSDLKLKHVRQNGDTLYADSYAGLSFAVENTSNIPLWGLKAKVQVRGSSRGIQYSRVTHLGHLGGKARATLSIPLYAAYFLPDGRAEANVTLLDANGREIKKLLALAFFTKAMPRPELQIEFITKDTQLIEREVDVPVSFRVRNVGKGLARQVEVELRSPYLVQVNPVQFNSIDTLRPGESITFNATIKVHWHFLEERFYLSAKAAESENEDETRVFNTLRMRLPSFFQFRLPDNNTPIILKNAAQKMKGHGPRQNAAPIFEEPKYEILWSFTDRDPIQKAKRKEKEFERNLQKVWYEPYIILRGILYQKGGGVLDTQFIRQNLKLKGTNAQEKKDAFCLSEPSYFDSLCGDGRYLAFFRTTELKEGKNAFTLELSGSSSGNFNIEYKPPTAHVLVVSVADEENRHMNAPENAEKFFHLMLRQCNNGLYHCSAANVKLYNDSLHSSDGNKIRNFLIKNLSNKIVQPQDWIFLYFSGHSDNDTTNFNLKFKNNNDEDFFKHLLADIHHGQYRKTFLFVDACNSGTLVKQFKEDMVKPYKFVDTDELLTMSTRNFHLYTSSRANQFSAQMDSLSLGLMTIAVEEAFTNKEINGPDGKKIRPDTNNNGELDNAELCAWLAMRIPMLAEEWNQKHRDALQPIRQNPVFLPEQTKDLSPIIKFRQ